jgi:hypothetical protein
MRRFGARRLRAIAVVATLAALLAGCSTIPRSGAIIKGGSVSGQEDELGPVDYIPSGPVAGSTQQQVLTGFIDAGVSPDGGYAIAKKFLTPSAASSWNPDASVTVYSGTNTPSYSSIDKTHIQLSVAPVASLGPNGTYQVPDLSTPQVQSYRFEKYRGQWRISKAPNGIVIDSDRFTNVFSQHPLYFYSPDFHYLVPDVRWFPSTLVSTPTRIVKELVAGPVKWLDGALVSSFPKGAALTVDSVTVSAGQADVDLNSVAGGVDQLTLDRMQLQLTQSLINVASVTSVKITVEGVQRTTTDLGANQPLQNPGVDTNPLVLKGDKFGYLSGNSVVSVPGISDKLLTLPSVSAVTLSADQSTAAVLASPNVYAVRSDVDAPQMVDDRPDLVAPSLDGDGYVWSVPSNLPNSILVGGPSSAPSSVAVNWPDAQAINAIAVSRDGTRIAALVQVAGQSHLMVAGIVRADNGRPDHLTDPLDLGALPTGSPRSLAWGDELTVDALIVNASGEATIWSQTIGGQSQKSAGPMNGIAIAGGDTIPPYWVLVQGGSLQEPQGAGWQKRDDGVSLLGVQMGVPR